MCDPSHRTALFRDMNSTRGSNHIHPSQPSPLFEPNVLFIVLVGEIEMADTSRVPRSNVLLYYYLFWPFPNFFLKNFFLNFGKIHIT